MFEYEIDIFCTVISNYSIVEYKVQYLPCIKLYSMLQLVEEELT